jgi:hypothetical protein
MALTPPYENNILLAAAFCEQVYRRSSNEQQLVSGPPDFEGFGKLVPNRGITVRTNLLNLDPGITQSETNGQNDGFYYNLSNGFVGQVIEANGKTFVVLRGSDLSTSFGSALKSLIFASPTGPTHAPETASTVDQLDWANNRILGVGTAEELR